MSEVQKALAVCALDTMPQDWQPVGVEAQIAQAAGRSALRVFLEPGRRRGTLGVDFGDEPTFVLSPLAICDGVVEVDLLSRLLPDAPDYARGFVGIAYRVQEFAQAYESVYLRPLNGLRLNPPPPRNLRAVQYYAYPEWKFDRLREEEPEGGYEAPADIAPDEWMTFGVELDGPRIIARVNGREVFRLTHAKSEPREGRIGLWVDIGTDAYFSNLRVARR